MDVSLSCHPIHGHSRTRPDPPAVYEAPTSAASSPIRPAKALSIQFAERYLISLCDKGSIVSVSIRPASDTVGNDIRLAKPVNRKRPGRRSSSTLFLIASSNWGARWTSSITVRSRLRIMLTGSSLADITRGQFGERHPERTGHLGIIVRRGGEDLLHI